MNSHPLGRVEARKFAHCFCVGINFSFARAIGATQEAHFISYCRLLPPRQSAKLLEGNRVTGAGDGNRTRTPFEFATIYVGQSVICMLPPCSKQMTWRFRGPIAAFSRLENPGSAATTTRSTVWDVGYKPTSPCISMAYRERPLITNSTPTKQRTGSRREIIEIIKGRVARKLTRPVNTSAFGRSRWRGGRCACNTPDVMCHEHAATLIQFRLASLTPLHMIENP